MSASFCDCVNQWEQVVGLQVLKDTKYLSLRTRGEVDCYERRLCLFLRVWAGEWLTSYTCTDPGLMLAPKHCRWGHCYCGQTRYYDVCWIQGFSRYWQAGSPSPDINKQSEFATSKICQILARKLIYSLSILVTSHESQQVNASRYIPYSILTVNYLH